METKLLPRGVGFRLFCHTRLSHCLFVRLFVSRLLIVWAILIGGKSGEDRAKAVSKQIELGLLLHFFLHLLLFCSTFLLLLFCSTGKTVSKDSQPRAWVVTPGGDVIGCFCCWFLVSVALYRDVAMVARWLSMWEMVWICWFSVMSAFWWLLVLQGKRGSSPGRSSCYTRWFLLLAC